MSPAEVAFDVRHGREWSRSGKDTLWVLPSEAGDAVSAWQWAHKPESSSWVRVTFSRAGQVKVEKVEAVIVAALKKARRERAHNNSTKGRARGPGEPVQMLTPTSCGPFTPVGAVPAGALKKVQAS